MTQVPGLDSEHRQFNDDQRRRVIQLLESIPMGDFDGALATFETALRLALDLTMDAFWLWESELEEQLGSEFEVEPSVAENLAPEIRLALIARLLRSAACCYGVTFDGYGKQPNGWNELNGWDELPGSLAALLRGTNDIAKFPTMKE